MSNTQRTSDQIRNEKHRSIKGVVVQVQGMLDKENTKYSGEHRNHSYVAEMKASLVTLNGMLDALNPYSPRPLSDFPALADVVNNPTR